MFPVLCCFFVFQQVLLKHLKQVSHPLPLLYILSWFPRYRELSHSREKTKTSLEKLGLGWRANKLILWHVGCASSGHPSPPGVLDVTWSQRPSSKCRGLAGVPILSQTLCERQGKSSTLPLLDCTPLQVKGFRQKTIHFELVWTSADSIALLPKEYSNVTGDSVSYSTRV